MKLPTDFDMVSNVVPNSLILEGLNRPAIGVAILTLKLVNLDGVIASIGKLNFLSQVTKILNRN